jgi:hypothetical protein
MTVIAFPPRRAGWRPAELERLTTLAPRRAGAGGWEVGATDLGDPQFYLLGPPPEAECLVCISRLGRLYVLEDGSGRVLSEHDSLMLLAEQARVLLKRKKAQLLARIAVLWCALRELVEEKLEPIVGESEELLVHVVPPLAALA